MADIDDMLLALAGGGESSDEEEMSDNESRAESMSPPPTKKKETGKAAPKKAPAKKAKKPARQEDSEEEGEASSTPASPISLESAPMEESDSEAEPNRAGHDEDEEHKYPIDGMFVSLAEKERVMSMREVERESLLADRQAEIEKQRQNRMLRLLVTKQENEEKKQKQKKRTADAADLDEGQRKTSRQRTRLDGTKVGETSSGIDTLRRARAEKNDRARRREEDRERNKDKRSPHNDRDFDGSGESDDDWPRDKRQSRTPEKEIHARELPPPEMRDFERIRVGKSHFAEFCFNPGFEAALIGCYVRIFLGQEGGEDCYRMALIKGFGKGRPYAMAGPSGGFVTDTYVTAAHGKAVKDFPFIFCSDRGLTEREYNRYKTTLEVEGLAVPKTATLVNKIEDINKFTRHHLTSDEIDARIARKNALRKKFDPKERERVAQEIDEAKARGKTELVEKLQEELDELLTNRLAHRTQLSPVKSATANTAQQERLAEVNRERRRKNAESVSKAQLKERAESRKLEAALARGENLDLDLSRRLRTRAKFVHDVNQSLADKKPSANGSGASTPANGTPKLGAQKQALLPHLAKLQAANNAEKRGLPTIHRPLMDDDIIAALDLDIDVDID